MEELPLCMAGGQEMEVKNSLGVRPLTSLRDLAGSFQGRARAGVTAVPWEALRRGVGQASFLLSAESGKSRALWRTLGPSPERSEA